MNRLSTTMACNVTRGFCLSVFVLELWLAHLDGRLGPLWGSKCSLLGFPSTFTVDLNCSRALGCVETWRKPASLLFTCSVIVTPTWHTYLVVSTILSSLATTVTSNLLLTTNTCTLQLCRLKLQCTSHAWPPRVLWNLFIPTGVYWQLHTVR